MLATLIAQAADLISTPNGQLTIQGLGAAGVAWTLKKLSAIDRRLMRLEMKLKVIVPEKDEDESA